MLPMTRPRKKSFSHFCKDSASAPWCSSSISIFASSIKYIIAKIQNHFFWKYCASAPWCSSSSSSSLFAWSIKYIIAKIQYHFFAITKIQYPFFCKYKNTVSFFASTAHLHPDVSFNGGRPSEHRVCCLSLNRHGCAHKKKENLKKKNTICSSKFFAVPLNFVKKK